MPVPPPLNHLQAFAAAAQHLSFQAAAKQLHVTPSAISQRIRSLESQLGVSLFIRLTRAVALTRTGEILAADLHHAFNIIDRSLAKIEKSAQNNTLTISTTISFAEKWLLTRLPEFSDLHPDLDVRVFSTDNLVDFHADGTDLAIRFGRGQYPGLISQPLPVHHYYPVCSPQVLAAGPPLECLEDLRNHTLIHTHWQTQMTAAPTWEQCLQTSGAGHINGKKGLGFSVETLSIRAAIDGLGITLANELLVKADLSSGILIKPFGDSVLLTPSFNYHLVFPEENAESGKLQQFREWLMAQVA